MKNTLYTLALLVSFSSFGQTASEYFKSGYYKESDHYGAISDYIKAIELNPNNDEMSYINNNGQKFYFSNHHVYYNIGVQKDELKDYYGAISDYTKAIELDPNYADAYSNRGSSKTDLKDYYGAIADYTKAIELNPNYAAAYYNRGYSKRELKDYYGAIAGYTKAIELNPNNAKAYSNRGISKEDLGDLNGACADWKKAAELGNTEAARWVANQCN